MPADKDKLDVGVGFAQPIPLPRKLNASDLVAGSKQLMPTAQLTGDGATVNDLALWDGAKWVPDHTIYSTVTGAAALYETIIHAAATYAPIATTETSAHAAATYATITNLALKAPIASPTFTGTATAADLAVTGSTTVAQLKGTVLSPAQIVADQNNYNPTSLATATILQLSSDALRTVTGLQGGAAGRALVVRNNGSFPIKFPFNSGSSSAGNQFITPDSTDYILAAADGMVLIYDGGTSFWYIIGARHVARGPSTQTPGAVTVVNIAHGLGATPTGFTALPGDANAANPALASPYYVTADATNVILTFNAVLTVATQYLWVWTATL